MYKISRCINFCGFHGPLRFICENEEIYIVMCNSHLKFSKSMKIYHLENLYTYGSKDMAPFILNEGPFSN